MAHFCSSFRLLCIVFLDRCTSFNVIRDPYVPNRPGMVSIIPDVSPTPQRQPITPLTQLTQLQENAFPGESFDAHANQAQMVTFHVANGFSGPRDSRSLPLKPRTAHNRSVSSDSIYTILIRLPDGGSGHERTPSIKMIQDDAVPAQSQPARRPLPSRDSDLSDIKLNLDR